MMKLLAAPVLFTALLLAQTDKPRVLVLSTGGTISGRGASSTSLTQYKSGALLGEELVKAVPEIQQYATVSVEQISNVGSGDITIDIWIRLA
ncbi:MAG: asparaginase, partial [Acidobacteriia bacterium]|nr:asparaginase [Terriglobia bacterium]